MSSEILQTTQMVTVTAPSAAGEGPRLCGELEAGNILFFPQTPFSIAQADREALLGQKQASTAFHKNVAYRPAEDRVTGLDQSDADGQERMRAILASYSKAA